MCVGNPLKVKSMFNEIQKKFNVLNHEVKLTRFMKYLNSVYIDGVR
ncbi:MAG: hypothetical protein ACRCX2_20845 [Paraclostridium sp.]